MGRLSPIGYPTGTPTVNIEHGRFATYFSTRESARTLYEESNCMVALVARINREYLPPCVILGPYSARALLSMPQSPCLPAQALPLDDTRV